LASVPTEDRTAVLRGGSVPSYWITHPAATAFISALTPEGIGQLLRIAEGWPIGRYPIRRDRHDGSPTGPEQGPWGHAIKERDEAVRIEPIDGHAADGGGDLVQDFGNEIAGG
jgi:hypothetical protein